MESITIFFWENFNFQIIITIDVLLSNFLDRLNAEIFIAFIGIKIYERQMEQTL